MPAPTNLIGPKDQTYADPKPSPDEGAFQVNNTSAAYYNSPYYKKHRTRCSPSRHNGRGRCRILI